MNSLHIPYAPGARHRRVSLALPLVIASYPGWTTASAQTPEIVVAGEVGSLASGQISSSDTATLLLLRPREFLANAWDLVTLKAAVKEQSPRYPDITAPVVIITGEADKTVFTRRHSRPFAAAVPQTKLIVLPEVGHMIQNAVPERVICEIDAMIGKLAGRTAVAAN